MLENLFELLNKYKYNRFLSLPFDMRDRPTIELKYFNWIKMDLKTYFLFLQIIF